AGGRADVPSDVVVEATDGRRYPVARILSSASAWGSRGHAHAESTTSLCETSCRLRIDEPMHLDIAGFNVPVSPGGLRERIVFTPARRGLWNLGLVTTALGVSGMITAGVMLSLSVVEEDDFDDRTENEPILSLNRTDRIALVATAGAGLVMTIVGAVMMRRGLARIDRVEF
ncbi:MAG: hypothetical protein AAF411_27705, partial [Myxococcota bacterium]